MNHPAVLEKNGKAQKQEQDKIEMPRTGMAVQLLG
jgi:hypothetical protein